MTALRQKVESYLTYGHVKHIIQLLLLTESISETLKKFEIYSKQKVFYINSFLKTSKRRICNLKRFSHSNLPIVEVSLEHPVFE